jgi:hypothetical protein
MRTLCSALHKDVAQLQQQLAEERRAAGVAGGSPARVPPEPLQVVGQAEALSDEEGEEAEDDDEAAASKRMRLEEERCGSGDGGGSGGSGERPGTPIPAMPPPD